MTSLQSFPFVSFIWSKESFYIKLFINNWHILRNENLALQLSYDLGLGCSPLFSNSTDYDSSYPWIRLRFVHLMGVCPVQTYCKKTSVSISLPSPTYKCHNMSIESKYLTLAKLYFLFSMLFWIKYISWKFQLPVSKIAKF